MKRRLLLITCAAVAVLQKRIAQLTPQPLQETIESTPPVIDDIIDHI